ncbi:GNAT family N-acetyltransferase [Sporolactobacillus shoreicorticis]|uniref:GNAT family N-acetyltransferase n=1 Tax=Sporolactobacillus shoreicorticis TaxID=1923877 RepID=A0ABW5S5P8_9BACL|nr:GNAT family N-acetyltransferase [Sporolactobacillus shoreicorticis]MCO7125892.1 GNAT family N-acetyltransferase [Sporolactobacillus shoreicorticis]
MDENKLIIREARKSDAAPILAFLKQIADESDFLTFGSVEELHLTIEKEEATFEKYAKLENALYLVAEYDGKIAGTLNFDGGTKKRTAHAGEFGICVRKDYWDKGIGRALITRMIEWSKETGVIRKINLRVCSDNPRAVNLYNSFGFEEEGIIKRDFLIDGTFYDSIHMGLFIDGQK